MNTLKLSLITNIRFHTTHTYATKKRKTFERKHYFKATTRKFFLN